MLKSVREFITSDSYLADCEICFVGVESKDVSHETYLKAVILLLEEVEKQMKSQFAEYQGTRFRKAKFNTKFSKVKTLTIKADDQRAESQQAFNLHIYLKKEDWYAQNDNWGTSEEKYFIETFKEKLLPKLQKQYSEISLVRNERELAIYDLQGQRFEPDFLLFCKQKDGNKCSYQVFIEPKGEHLMEKDRWKEDFLKKLGGLYKADMQPLDVDTEKYVVVGVPFYNHEQEKDFVSDFNEIV